MNYYKQGDAANAEQIKAAFEMLGYDTGNLGFTSSQLYYTIEGKVELMCTKSLQNLIKTHPDYQELPLPKPHYDIANFKPFDKVLVRDEKSEKWVATFYSYYRSGENYHPYNFVTIGTDDVWIQCIPFEGNEHLLGTTDMPSEEYINW
jgi:hypothetical protein